MSEVQRHVRVKFVAVLNGIIALVAIAALIVSLTSSKSQIQNNKIETQNNQHQITAIQNARQDSATKTCYTLRILTTAAYGSKYYNQSQDLLRRVGLGDCIAYGKSVRTGKGQ